MSLAKKLFLRKPLKSATLYRGLKRRFEKLAVIPKNNVWVIFRKRDMVLGENRWAFGAIVCTKILRKLMLNVRDDSLA